MKKKFLGLLLLITLVCSCGSGNGTSNNVTSENSSNNSINESFTSDENESSIESSDESSENSSEQSSSDTNGDIKSITISEFLSQKDTTTFYKLSGTVTKITNSTYGNFILEDNTGSVFVWGLLPSEGSSDKTAFSSLNINVGDKIVIVGRYEYYAQNSQDEVVDAYFISKESSGGTSTPDSTNHLYNDFKQEEKDLFIDYFGEVIPFIPNDEYYVEEYSEVSMGEYGINFYTFGNTQQEFNAYLSEFSSYQSAGTEKDEYGDTWYYFDKNDFYVDFSFYYYEGEYVLDLYAYYLTDPETDNDNGTDVGGGSTSDVNLITNEGKGLPSSQSGVYDIDFTKGKYVKNVTDQGYYLDGCPTLSTETTNPAVLVVPVEFSDVTASSKNFSIDNIKKAFLGEEGETDYYSVHDYYYTSSYGQLDLDITVLDTWFRPKNTSSYYASATMDYEEQEVECGDQLIINELLASLESTMDLTKFDSDGNGIIDSIVLINTLDIDSEVTFNWAYRYWNLYTDDEGYYYEYDGVSANDYLWASYSFMHEDYDSDGNVSYNDTSIMNTYTYIHEFGHVLGADDYYDTAYINSPLGGCDIMDSLAGDHNPYSKFNYGWLTSSRLVVAEESVTLELEDFSQNGDTIIIANNWDDELGAYQEYYVVMYYTNNGLNSNGYGYFSRDGIVVYHVNASLYSEEYDGETYYDVYNTNTDASDQYGTADNLIEFVKTSEDAFTYVVGDSLASTLVDDQGNSISYTFTVDALSSTSATLTFTKN